MFIKKNIKASWLLLPVETKARELDSKILFSCFAAEEGYGVIVGNQHYLTKHYLELYPVGIYFEKGISPHKHERIKYRKTLGHNYVCLDEEGLVYFNCETYLKDRTSDQTFNELTSFFTWGEEQEYCINSKYMNAETRVIITGSPRVDVCRKEYRNFFGEERDQLKNAYEPYLLINSNFGRVNHFQGSDFPFEYSKRIGRIKNVDDKKKYETFIDHKLKIFNKFLDLLPILSEKFPNHKIIVRPHPSESHEAWKNQAKQLQNVEVINNFDNIIPWLLGADAVIHNSCTTGVEAYLLDTPVFSYRPYTSDEFDSYLPNALSNQAFDSDTLVKMLKKAVEDRASMNYKSKAKKEIAARYMSSLEGEFACEKIIKALNEIEIKPRYFKPFNDKKKNVSSTELFKKIIKKALLKTPVLSSKLLGKERINNWKESKVGRNSYSSHKFPGLAIEEVEQSIKKFSLLSGRFKNLKVYPAGKDCFCIVNKE